VYEPLLTALSPYHLVTREPAAMAALVLGTRTVTLMPHPPSGTSRESVELAVRRSPRYLRLMEAWRWSMPLWRVGVIATRVGAEGEGEEANAVVPAVYDDIRNDAALAELRPLTRSADALSDDKPDAFLDAMAADLLRGGPDPGISIPLNAALERFSERHGLVVVRGAASSIAQRAESRLGAKFFSFAVPMLVQAGAERLLLLRHDLEGPLRALRKAMLASFEGGTPHPALAPAAARFGEVFRLWTEQGLGKGDDETGHRVMTAFVSVTGMQMPADAVLRSSRAAVRSVGGYSAVAKRRNDRGGGEGEAQETAVAMQRTLIIREMNVVPV
jgi:hypothetical protein